MHTNDRCRVRIAHLHHQVDACEAIARALPVWFGIDEGLQGLRTCLETGTWFVALDGERVTGFLTFAATFPETREIIWMTLNTPWQEAGVIVMTFP